MNDERRIETLNAAKGELNEKDGYDCKLCNNRGVIFYLRQTTACGFSYTETVARKCSCMNRRRAIRELKTIGLINAASFSFENYETPEDWQKDIKALACWFIKDPAANCFYIGGQRETGKTHICTAVILSLAERGFKYRCVLWGNNTAKLKNTAFLKTAEVLYIDNFLKCSDGAKPTAANIRLAADILNARINDSKKITVISSRFTAEQLLSFDNAVINRMLCKAGRYKLSIEQDINKNYRLKRTEAERCVI